MRIRLTKSLWAADFAAPTARWSTVGLADAAALCDGQYCGRHPASIIITYPEHGDSVSTSPDIPVTMTVEDDAGVGLVEALVDEETIGTDAPTATVTAMTAIINWVASGLLPQSNHDISAVATDIAGQEAGASDITVIARPEHCLTANRTLARRGLIAEVLPTAPTSAALVWGRRALVAPSVPRGRALTASVWSFRRS